MQGNSWCEKPRTVVVSVGTDHHPFNRLMDWVEQWTIGAPDDVSVVVQHGASRPPRGSIGHYMLPKQELVALMATADAVLVQGGPGGIMDARRAGRMPIAVPRLGRLGEAVDDHQVSFCRHMAAAGKLVIAENAREAFAALDCALADPDRAGVQDDIAHVATTVRRFGDAVDQLLGSRTKALHRLYR